MGVYCAQTWKPLMIYQTPPPHSAWSPLATNFWRLSNINVCETHIFIYCSVSIKYHMTCPSSAWKLSTTTWCVQFSIRENCIFKDFVTICWESCNCHSPAFHPRRFPPERKTVKVKVVDSTFLFYDWETNSEDDSGLFLDISKEYSAPENCFPTCRVIS